MKRPNEEVDSAPAGPVFDESGKPVLPRRSTLKPTGHRYANLIERARRLVTLAEQVEAAYLNALEKGDNETYRRLEAGQHLDLAKQGVQLQQLRVNEASDSRQLAVRRQQKTQIARATYQDWLDAGQNDWEKATLAAYATGGTARVGAIAFQTAASIAHEAIQVAQINNPAGAGAASVALTAETTLGLLGAVAGSVAATADTAAQISSM